MTFIEAMKIMWAVICLIIIIWALNADKKHTSRSKTKISLTIKQMMSITMTLSCMT